MTTRRHALARRALERTAQALLAAVGLPDAALSLSLVGDRRMRTLNRLHRGRDRPTDVLSFPLYGSGSRSDPAVTRRSLLRAQRSEPEVLLGDVVISLDTAQRQADGYGATLRSEVERLLVHGLLHLIGYDHEVARDRARMVAQERRLAAAIGLPWPYD